MPLLPKQISQRRLLLAIACLLVELAWANWVLSWRNDLGESLAIIIYTPVTAVTLGGGIGLLFGKFGQGILIALAVEVAWFFIVGTLAFSGLVN